MNDAELILASRTDPAAFRELYDGWAERLLAHFYAEGCAVYCGPYIRSRDGRTEIVAELTQRDAPVGP